MAMIPEEEIERIKRETDLAAVVRARGVELKPQGGDLVGLCPFHDDHHPSLHVTPAKRLWRCVSCQATGNVIQFVQKFDGVSFRHAVELLKTGTFAAVVGPGAPRKKSTVPKLDSPLSSDADDQAALRQVLDYYHERLKENPAALAYLQKRGLRDEEALSTFKVGFVDRTLGLRLPQKNRAEGAALRERLQRLGVLRDTGHEHLRGRLVFPIPTDDGAIGTVYGRAIDEHGKHERHLFLPGPQRGLWNPAALKSATVILTEGILDALTFWCAGFKNVTACLSAKRLPDELIEAFVAARVQRLLLALDRDTPGEEGAAEINAQFSERGIECLRVLFPHGQDANEYARKVKPADKSLGVLLNAAVPMDLQRKAGVSSRLAPAPFSLAASAAEEEAAKKEAIDAATTTPRNGDANGISGAGSLTLQQRGEHWFLDVDGREYRVGGVEKTLGSDTLKVTLRLRVGDRFHLDALDLARDAERRRFVERAAEETGLHADRLKRDLGRLLLALEQTQAALSQPAEAAPSQVELTPEEREEALAWLRAPDLIGRLRAAFRAAGIIGEQTNALVAYLAGVSRQLERPLAIIVQSASAAGKTTLMDAVLAFFPEEDRVKYSAMTGQSLYYLGETNLKHKILAVVEEAGAEKASYALKLLQSEGELTIASTGKDPHTGRMETQEYRVEGPVMIMLTTTAIDLDEELQNRCLTLAVDESPEQTARIHAVQRERRTLAGLLAKTERDERLRMLRNAQRLLAPVEVVNSYAPALTFPSGRTRTRRDHEKYLTLIDAIALLHQHQRQRGRHEVGGPSTGSGRARIIETIEVTLEDIALANELAPEILGRSLDELPPQTRRLLDHVRALVRSRDENRRAGNDPAAAGQPDAGASVGAGTRPCFTRRELHEACGWSFTQLRVHLDRLVEHEYLGVRCGRFGSLYIYELLIEADPASAGPLALLDVAELRKRHDHDRNLAGQNGHLAGGNGTHPRGLNLHASSF